MDNKSSEFATWNYEVLLQELEELRIDDYNLDLAGFNLSEFEQLEDKYNQKEIQEDEDFDIEEQLENIEEPKSKRGDIWLIGNNRLLCGDSTLKEDVEKLMNGQKANLVFTDTPYNINYEGATADKLTIANDNMTQNEFYEFLSKVFNNYYENMEE